MQQLDFGGQMGGAGAISTDIFDFVPAIFPAEASDRYTKALIAGVPWEQTSILIYGKEVRTPRLTAWFGDSDTDYSISGTHERPHPWRDDLLEIKRRVEEVSGSWFNGVLLNYYRDGNDSVSWHSDGDGIPGRNLIVASVSFGQERVFDIRNKSDHKRKFSLLLTDGSYLLMKGDFQDHWQHRIAKSKKVMGPRVNLTFRVLRK